MSGDSRGLSTFVYCVNAIAILDSGVGSVVEVGGGADAIAERHHSRADRDRPFRSFVVEVVGAKLDTTG